MTNPTVQAAEAMREAAAKAIDNSICDVAENCEIFMYHRDYFVAIVRAIPLPEPAPDPREATIARLSAELETASNSVLDALNHLDPIVHALGIEDSFKTPLEAIAEKDAAIARLSAELSEKEPNPYCDTPLWRVTEREAGDELAERCAEQMQRAIKAEDDLAAAKGALVDAENGFRTIETPRATYEAAVIRAVLAKLTEGA